MRIQKMFLLAFLVLSSLTASAYTAKEVKRIYDNCVWLQKQTPARKAQFRKKIGNKVYNAVASHCGIYLRNGLARDIALEREYDEYASGRHSRGGSRPMFPGSLGCLNNEHYVNGSCQPKSLVRCDNGGECAFGESCTAGVCH